MRDPGAGQGYQEETGAYVPYWDGYTPVFVILVLCIAVVAV